MPVNITSAIDKYLNRQKSTTLGNHGYVINRYKWLQLSDSIRNQTTCTIQHRGNHIISYFPCNDGINTLTGHRHAPVTQRLDITDIYFTAGAQLLTLLGDFGEQNNTLMTHKSRIYINGKRLQNNSCNHCHCKFKCHIYKRISLPWNST